MLWTRNLTSIALCTKQEPSAMMPVQGIRKQSIHTCITAVYELSLIRYIFWDCKKTFIRNVYVKFKLTNHMTSQHFHVKFVQNVARG